MNDWFEQVKKNSRKESIMCAYKLCRVEFRYWGMQSKCERFIHEIGTRLFGFCSIDKNENVFFLHSSLALRKTILRAHRQAWCWQDEYQGLTLADIRRLEDETQQELNKRMAQFQNEHSLLRNSLSHNETGPNLVDPNSNTDEINPALTNKRNRQMSIDNINANRSRINSFPVPPLPREETPDDEYFDAECE